LGYEIFIGFSISRVQECSYVGKTSIFSMLLEGETSMVSWHPNLDLTHFHDLVNILTSSPYPLQIIKGEELSGRNLAWMRLALEILGLYWIGLSFGDCYLG
jgi:hypothetical protein